MQLSCQVTNDLCPRCNRGVTLTREMHRLRVGLDVMRFGVPLVALLYVAVFGAPKSEAVVNPNPPPPLPSSSVSPQLSPQLVVTNWTVGGPTTGFLAQSSNTTFDPARDMYPTSNPTSGFDEKNEGFAGLINAAPPGGGATVQLYCIDIATGTWDGIGYRLGSWNSANVPNVGFVVRILNEYYPTTSEPASLDDPTQKAAAVQAAIWFFSDRYVLSTSDPLYTVVAAIVTNVQLEGPWLRHLGPRLPSPRRSRRAARSMR